MNRGLTVFAKGNLDVRDSLHSLRLDGVVAWNGVNEIVRARFPAATIRIKHELYTRSDALLAATGTAPAALDERRSLLEPYTPETQFSRALFETKADAYVLSIQPDIMTALYRHRSNGYLLSAIAEDTWPAADRDWLAENFAFNGVLDVDASMRNLERIIAHIRANNDAPILAYNVSSVVPGESVRNYAEFPESLSTRIRRFNLGLIEVSERNGIWIIDVDTIVARAGADRTKIDTLHLTAEGCRLVAGEVVDTLEQLDLFSGAAV
ncbi:MAG TPA: SGNH/GDSL hydrolase family protein [Candidatus Baltobacteraceae bacterium]